MSDPEQYRVFTWDHERQGWMLEAENYSLWPLRRTIRYLRKWWEDCGILVVGPRYADFVEVPRDEDDEEEAEPVQGELFA